MTVFRRVTLPLVAPSLVAGAVLSWARALGEFGATITFAGNFPGRTQTMPVAVYIALQTDPDAAIALSLVLLVVSVTVLVLLRDRWLRTGVEQPVSGLLRVHGEIARGTFTVDLAGGRRRPARSSSLLGPNGAGKTTLLRAVAGLEPLQRGRIELDGQLLDDGAEVFVPPEAARGRAGVPGLPALPAPVRAGERRLRGALGRRAPPGRPRRCPGVARPAGRRGAGRPPSGPAVGRPGAARRAGPRAGPAARRSLLLDEPLAALDARARLELRVALRRHLVDFGGPVVVVSHDPVEAMVMADRLVVVEGGRVVQQGRPADVARRPATDYVARLVGPEPAARQGVAESAVSPAGRRRRPAAAPSASWRRASGCWSPSRRPRSACTPTGPGPGSARNVWPGVVDGLEPLHDRVRVHVEAQPPLLVDVTPAAVAELGLRPGSPVWLSVKATEVEVYPSAAG